METTKKGRTVKMKDGSRSSYKDLASDLVAILGVGDRNAKTFNEISLELGIKSCNNGTSTELRLIRWEDVYSKQLPIVTSNNGVFIAETKEELMKYVSTERGRISSIVEHIETMEKFHKYLPDSPIKKGTI